MPVKDDDLVEWECFDGLQGDIEVSVAIHLETYVFYDWERPEEGIAEIGRQADLLEPQMKSLGELGYRLQEIEKDKGDMVFWFANTYNDSGVEEIYAELKEAGLAGGDTAHLHKGSDSLTLSMDSLA